MSKDLPSHSAPPYFAGDLVLLRVCIPWPQVTEQGHQFPHPFHLQSTASKIVKWRRILYNLILALSGLYGPLLAHSGYNRKRCIFLIGISLAKAFPVAHICPNLHKIVSSSACKFGQICATAIAFVRLIVGRNSILNFPAKIWTEMCIAFLCCDDSSHSQRQSGKRLLLASRGHPVRTQAYKGSCIDQSHQSHPPFLIRKERAFVFIDREGVLSHRSDKRPYSVSKK